MLIQLPLSIEMQDIEIDTPDITIGLPWWLEWLAGVLVGVIAGPIAGVIAGFLFSSIIASLIEAFIPSGLGSHVPEPEGRPVRNLPPGVTIDALTVVPEFLGMSGRWFFSVEDPREFQPRVAIVERIDREKVGPEREGTAWFSCWSALGFLADSTPQWGTPFPYTHQSWRSRVVAEVEATAVPLPLTRFPWTIAVGHRSITQSYIEVITTAPQPLVPGEIIFTTNVWRPEPPLGGKLESATFSIGVQRGEEDRFTLDVPPNAACVLIELKTKVVDAAGITWDLSRIIDVPNETVTFGPEFEEFARQCESGRREFQWVEEPSELDKVWNPPDYFATKVRRAIRTEQPALTTAIATLLEDRGTAGLNVILAPSQVQRG
ncbi:MAG: hypothetical protein L0271_03395 [Gemmatimonadetes bacterium]|nr:hypothetical protein [Gemmatimonadota bacterium]